jgi:hypothetical protein
VSHTPHHPLQECTHQRGPGTTLCLHCRHEARLAARIKRKRLMMRGAAAAIVVATALAATALGATAIRGRHAARRAESVAKATNPPVATVASVAFVPGAVSSPVVNDSVQRSSVPPKDEKSISGNVSATAPLMLIVPPGESPLPDGVTAFRNDAVVTVSFDTPLARTRVAEKFERFVRATLPAVFGSGADSALAKLPVGTLANQGNLITELPSTGVRIPVGSVWEIRVYPETRKGLDGPLVIRYRTTVCGTHQSGCGAP